ncbi:MAG: RDD family protein [Alphaproteobacteria bacterium]
MPENDGLPSLRLGPGTRDHAAWDQAPPDPLAEPDLYDSVLPRRATAYVLDLALIFGLWIALSLVFGVAGILTFGALTPLGLVVLAVLPVGYHTFFIGRDGATPGMRMFDLEVRSWTGRPPDYSQAFLTTVLFYASVSLTVWLVLLVPLFTDRNRTLHDILAGTIVLRRARLRTATG